MAREGDIEIVEIGLRPGEKMHEELLIDNQGMPTSHPRIVRASDRGMGHAEFQPRLAELLDCLERRDAPSALALMERLILRERKVAPAGDATLPRPVRPEKQAKSSSAKRGRSAQVIIGKRALES